MNTFIFLGCVPVFGWQHKIDFVTKALLHKKKYLHSGTKKKTAFKPLAQPTVLHLYFFFTAAPQRMPLGRVTRGFRSKKSGNSWGSLL